MRNFSACIDANIAVMIVVPEPQRPIALALFKTLLEQPSAIVAPRLFAYEITSVLWRKTRLGVITLSEARQALVAALDLQVEIYDPPALSERAFELAAHYRLPATYDAHYLALAEQLECPFWTADERLFNTVEAEFPLIRWLGNFKGE